jgi:co-chaperonin GroES (HSP10)
MSKTIIPLGNMVLVRLVEAEETTKSGDFELYIPPTAVDGLNRAVVIAVGKGTKDVQVPEELVPEATAIVPKNLRNEFKVDGAKHYLLHIEEILGVEK